MIEIQGASRLIEKEIQPNVLSQDLERYRDTALSGGADEAKVIPAHLVHVDERVRLKCLIPRCQAYGQCASCPPYLPETEFFRAAFAKYNWAVLFKKNIVPADDYADQTRFKQGAWRKHGLKLTEIVGKIETLAFSDGYYLALGLALGSCGGYFCFETPCQVIDSGRCRHPLRARPSMEAASIDVFGLVASVGWKGYPIYGSVKPELVPLAISVGIVFVH